VQTVLCEALASEHVPEEHEALRKWVVGIARHKIADHHRRLGRRRTIELDDELPDLDENHVQATSTRDLARWADEQVGDDATAQRTLEWMAREGEGETLAQIAAEAELPPDQVRQRVSRLRRWMRERWARELAAAIALAGLALFVWWRVRDDGTVAQPTPVFETPSARPPDRPAGEVPSAATSEVAPPVSAAPSASETPPAPQPDKPQPDKPQPAKPQPDKPQPAKPRFEKPPLTPERAPQTKRPPKEAPLNLPLGKQGLYGSEPQQRKDNVDLKSRGGKNRFETPVL